MIINKYRQDEDLIRLTIEQIKKDFGTLLPELIFSGNKSLLFDELSEQVSAALKNIKKNNSIAFRSLLYKVDIREQDVRELESKYLLKNLSELFFRSLAEKIIQREFQKVLTRNYLSPPDNG